MIPFLSVAVLLLGLAVANPATATFAPSAYAGAMVVPTPAGPVDFFWRVEGSGASERGFFALSVPTTSGWIGFGVGEINSGSMPGSDIAIATVDAATSALSIGDYFALGFATPQPDCSSTASDWSPVAASRNGTHTTIEFSRLLAVADADEDRAIARGPGDQEQKFLVAWGSGAALAYHGRNQRAMFQVNVFGTIAGTSPAMTALLRDPTVSVLRWYADNLVIPAVETTYADSRCVSAAEANGTHVVAFDVHVHSEANRKYLHHMVVYGYSGAACNGRPTILWGVASAHIPFVLPSDVSLALVGYGSYAVQIHYDNPGLDEGVVDASGVNVYIVRTPRTNQAGVLTTADPVVQTPNQLLPGYTTIDYDCPGRCTRSWAENITVFGELLHMHQTGNYMLSEFVAADGVTVIGSSLAEWYSFHAQQNQLVQRTVVPPGSSIRTRCVFKVNAGSSTEFGIASSEEMCMHFIYYYPVQQGFAGSVCGLRVCGGITASVVSENPPQRTQFNGTCGVTAAPTPQPMVPIAAGSTPTPVVSGAAFVSLGVVAATAACVLSTI